MKGHLLTGILLVVSLLVSSAILAETPRGGTVKGGSHLSVKFDGSGKPYKVTAHAADKWKFVGMTHISNTVNWKTDGSDDEKDRWGETKAESSDENNELFSIRIWGKIVPDGTGPGGGPPPPTDWSVKGTYEGDFSIVPNTLKIGIKKQGTFNTENGGSGTTWKIKPFDGGTALPESPTGESITIGPGGGADILISAGKWIVEATEGSNSDTAVLTVVKTEKIVVPGTNDEGPILVLEGASEKLEAIPFPKGESFPSDCPDWAIETKPSDSSIADPSDGNKTVTITPDKVGKYKILSDFATFDMYAYKFEFERYTGPGTHGVSGGSIEGTRSDGTTEGGLLDGFVSDYGDVHLNSHLTTNDTANIEFGMKAFGYDYSDDYGVGSTLQPSGERWLFVFVNVGNATNVPVNITFNSILQSVLVQNILLPGNYYGIERGGSCRMALHNPSPPNESVSWKYDRAVLFWELKTQVLGNNPLSKIMSVSGKQKIGDLEASVQAVTFVNLVVESRLNTQLSAKYEK